MKRLFALMSVVLLTVVLAACTGLLNRPEVDRGRYLVEIMGCNDCHTPGYMEQGGVPESDWLVGDDLGYSGPWGTAYPTNLRLLLNDLSEDQWLDMAKEMRKTSPMSWVKLPKASDADLVAIYRFVQYLGPQGRPAPSGLPAGVEPKTPTIGFPSPH
jgi:mono/diheme cytochrome c family protein